MYDNAFTKKFGSSLWDSIDYDTLGQYEEYAKKLGGDWSAEKLYDFQTANNGALPLFDPNKEQLGILSGSGGMGLAGSTIDDILKNESTLLDITGKNPITEKGYFDKLLSGDAGAIGVGNLALKGAGLAASLIQLPDMLAMNKEALKGARLQNKQAKKSLDYHDDLSKSAFS